MKVEKTNRAVEVVKTHQETVYVLELSRDEACALLAVVGQIGGNRSTDNVRDVTDNVYHELQKAGLSYFSEEVTKYARHLDCMRVKSA